MKNLTYLFVVFASGCGQIDSGPQTLKDGGEPTARLERQLRSRKYAKIDSVVILQGDEPLFAEYRNGYDADKPHDIASVTKSITSLLVGIAIDHGHIDTVDQPVVKFFEGSRYQHLWPEDKKSISVRNLLTMQHGIDCNDHDDPGMKRFRRWLRSKDRIATLLEMPCSTDRGKKSVYCTASTELLRQVLEKTTGQSVQDFADAKLFRPLGITSFQWDESSGNGAASVGFGAKATPVDLAKIGVLIHQKGQWNGKQVVSESWLNESFKRHGTLLGIDYGYLWYGEPYKLGGKTFSSNLAMGHGGQFLINFPQLHATVVVMASDYQQKIDFYEFVQELVLPVLSQPSRTENVTPELREQK